MKLDGTKRLYMTDDSRRDEYLNRVSIIEVEIAELEEYVRSVSTIEEPADAAQNEEYQQLLTEIDETIKFMEKRIDMMMEELENDFPFRELTEEEAAKYV